MNREAPLNSPWRPAAAAALVVTAAIHLRVLEDHVEEAPYIGVLFAVLAMSCLGLAALLVRRDARWVWRAARAVCAMAIAALVWSRAIGLPQITDDVGRWTEPLALLAAAAEAAAVGLATLALRPHQAARALPRPLPAVLAATLLLGGMAGTVAAAASKDDHAAGMASMAHGWDAVAGRPGPKGVTRTYYLRAEEVAWNYAPDGRNDLTGQPFDDVADTYVKSGPGRIGATYLKCLYRGYTDGSFTTPAKRDPDDAYLGLLGPVIRAAVGDTIRVEFRNDCRFPASVHPHGVFYNKDSEGAPYDDGTSGAEHADDAVPPGGAHTYVWQVPERAGPGPGDGSSVMWMYHSHTDEVHDTYAGLMGPMEITRRGMARADGSPRDVDREVFALFSVMNENQSPYLEENVRRYAQPPPPGHDGDDDEDFEESNLMHSINGYVYGNLPLITMHKGQHVRWYVMSMGTEVDLHTPHWHGNTVLVNGMRMDTVSLLPASMVVADMVPDDVGTWLFHCHVNDHLTAGMAGRYQVLP
jgi:hypothetical protein